MLVLIHFAFGAERVGNLVAVFFSSFHYTCPRTSEYLARFGLSRFRNVHLATDFAIHLGTCLMMRDACDDNLSIKVCVPYVQEISAQILCLMRQIKKQKVYRHACAIFSFCDNQGAAALLKIKCK